MKELLELFENAMEDKLEKNQIVIKTVPAKKEWVAKMKELHEIADKITKETQRMKAMRQAFWSEVELSLNDYSNMRYNSDTKGIEILKTRDAKDGVKSPYMS